MNDLQVFQNNEFGEVRVTEIDGKPYAVGVDVARVLDYANPSKAVIAHCKGISKIGIPSVGGVQETNWDCPICGAEIQKVYAVRDEDGVMVAIECECGEFAAFKYIKLEEMQIEE